MPGSLLKKLILVSRIPFLPAGILPFLLGSFIAYKSGSEFKPGIFLWALLALILIMIVTNINGEIYDVEEDSLSAKLGRNAFSGGSQVMLTGGLKQSLIKAFCNSLILIALAIGLMLQFYFKTGKYTLLLGLTGVICGYFYSKPPFRWVKRGFGELLIGYCFGWLAVAAGFYLQSAKFTALLSWVSIPIACSIFNVILINEFPDYLADLQAGKRNFLVRVGRHRGALAYLSSAIIAGAVFLLSLFNGVPVKTAIFYLPFYILSFMVAILMVKQKYNNPVLLVRMCGLTIIVNLGFSLAYILGFS